MNILVNDGISEKGGKMLLDAGFKLFTQKVPQDKLVSFMNKNHIEILLVRGATQVPLELIDDVPSLKLIGRVGVGLDNIDVEFAKEMGIHVINTPNSSAQSVAELVIAHLFTIARNLHDSNRNMPLEGDTYFVELKRAYANSIELKGKTIGIIGVGAIGKEVAKLAYSIGMRPIGVDRDGEQEEEEIEIQFSDNQSIKFKIPFYDLEEALSISDVVTVHTPKIGKYILDDLLVSKMKQDAILINASRGGTVDEKAVIEAIEEGKLRGAAFDVFESEPSPEMGLLMHPKLSLSPHIGGTTIDAQQRIGQELAEKIIEIFGKQN